jgi:hypothetical protein
VVQPQKLFIDERVDEALPGVPAAGRPAADAAAAAQPPSPLRRLSVAPFHSHEHATEGRARVIRLADGRRYGRFERFRTSNGPVLRVYLSAASREGPGGRSTTGLSTTARSRATSVTRTTRSRAVPA